MKRFVTILVLSTGLAAGPAMAGHDNGRLLSKENVGGAIGATVGAFVGSKIGKGNGRLATTAAGAVGGFLIGENVAHNYRGRGDRSFAHREYRTARVYPMDETLVARTTSNVRAGPSTRFHVTDQLYRHERVRVVGKVGGRNWYMISTHGRRGFVYAPLLRPDHHGRHRGWGHDDHDRWDHDRGPGRRDWNHR